jgi:IS605 OrfB family transposase
VSVSEITIPVKLVCDRQSNHDLVATLRACNEAANFVSTVAWETNAYRKFSLHHLTYGEVRHRFGLAAQAAVRVIGKVADAYNSGKVAFRRGARLRRFRWSSAQPFDARNLSWDHQQRTVSIWTVNGRRKGVRFTCANRQAELLAEHPIGECDLVYRNGCLYLYATVEVPDAPMAEHVAGWLGVDMGIVNPATTSEGENLPRPIRQPPKQGRPEKSQAHGSGAHINAVRYRNLNLRQRLQQKGTRSAKRLLQKRSGTEARFATDVNHRISKTIVAEAERTGRGIARELLDGVLERARSRKPQRVALHSWSFHQLGAFIDYKARRAGVPVEIVDPAYTSQRCCRCGHICQENRRNRDTFCCTMCGLSLPADWNAAINIAQLGEIRWGGGEGWAVSHAAERHTDLPVV